MYKMHYEEIKPQFPKSQLLFTDTDSLCYLIETDDIYKDMVDNMITGNQLYDMSEFPDDHKCFRGLDSEMVQNIRMVNK